MTLRSFLRLNTFSSTTSAIIMTMKQHLQLRTSQQLTMTPQLQQAIRFLQLSSMELEQEITHILATNPLLENDEGDMTDPESSHEEDNIVEDDFMKIDLSSDIESNWDSVSETGMHPNPHHDEFYNQDLLQQKASELTLHKHLLWQMELAHFSEEEHAIAWALIDGISEDGYLTCTLDEIGSSTGLVVTSQDIEDVLIKIQQFDPLGVGARSLAECLSLQLQALTLDTPWLNEAKKVVHHHLDLLAKRDYPKLKQFLKIPQQGLDAVIKILTALDPKPGRKISTKRLEYIIPDIIVRKKNTGYSVELNKEFNPQLRINPKYAALIQSVPADHNTLLKENLKEAKWFIKSLHSRQKTLLSVATHIMKTQKKFLDQGEEHMKPLVLQDVATVVGLHESTISRITTHKYVLTPRGVFELKFFFSNTLTPKSKEDLPLCSTAVRALIKKWIQQEIPQNPLSDQQIVEKLNAEHIHIARRTVAKYREALRIPASHERKACILKVKGNSFTKSIILNSK